MRGYSASFAEGRRAASSRKPLDAPSALVARGVDQVRSSAYSGTSWRAPQFQDRWDLTNALNVHY